MPFPALLFAAAALWSPSDLRPATDTLETVLAKARLARADAGAPAGQRAERFDIEETGVRVTAQARIRDGDYAIAPTSDARLPAVGRSGGVRWRRNASGTVHLIRADVQGDDFDRWPVTAFGFSAADCSVAGVALVPRPAWVLAYRPARDIPRWLYVDEETGDIVREISREGNRVETYDFSDVRGAPGARRPFVWRISGPGGTAMVKTAASAWADVAASDVAIPAQAPPVFEPPSRPQKLDAAFSPYNAISTMVRLDGHPYAFHLDSGTPELIISDPPRSSGSILLEHGIAPQLDVSGAHASGAAFLAVHFFYEGLLGFDYFRGRIVHVDYADRRVDVLPRDTFVPPIDAIPLPTDWSEGMPLVSASVGRVTARRFVLDLGSQQLFLSRDFVDQAGAEAGLDMRGATPSGIPYLEGRIATRVGRAPSLQLGGIEMIDAPAAVEQPDPANLAIPLDGILGTDELSPFEWWFDADGPLTWFRRNR